MRKFFIFAFILILVVLLAACDSSPKLKEFRSEIGRFSVTAPVAFKKRTQSVETQVGKIDIHMFLAQQGDKAYCVGYSDYPQILVQHSDPEKILDGGRNGAVSNVNGKLVLETKISLEGNPGRELVMDAKAENGQEATVKTRIFMVKNRLYQVTVVAPKGRVSAAEMDDFLLSFRLLGK